MYDCPINGPFICVLFMISFFSLVNACMASSVSLNLLWSIVVMSISGLLISANLFMNL